MGVEGIWYDELGSKLEILPVAGDVITGLYETAAGSTGCAKGQFPIQGRTDIDRAGSTCGFAVTWLNATSTCNSTTAWAGLYVGTAGKESITAFWLLVTKGTAGAVIGQSHFTRTKPTDAQVAEAAAHMRPAYP